MGDPGTLLKECLCCHKLHVAGVQGIPIVFPEAVTFQGVLIVSRKAVTLHLALRSVDLS